ncbi:hypothetical protein F4604DRAFT_1939928 [Suillus subluteus]|nr:hypothetical protein F4604DRAFT_1939928 [Suillus subluteus]
MSGWPGGNERFQAWGHHHDIPQFLYINNTADPLMGLLVDHYHDKAPCHSFIPQSSHNAVATGMQGGTHHQLQIVHPIPHYGIPSIFYSAWSMPLSPDPPPDGYAEDHQGGPSMHQNQTYPGHGSSYQPKIMMPMLDLELFDNIPLSQPNVTLEPSSSSSYKNIDDVTKHTKIDRTCGRVGTVHTIFKATKLVSMERAQLARKIQAGVSSATVPRSSVQSSESDVKIVPGSGTDQDWAMEMLNNKSYINEKLGSMINNISKEMSAVAKNFTYLCYGVKEK